MKKSTAILLGATMALSGISACRASAPASTMTPVPTRYGVFSEALVPFGTSAPAESAALRRAISRYRAGGNAAQTRPLDRFLKRHPDSVWRIALLTNEGLAYAHAGKFSLALNRLEAAWDAGRSARGQRQRALVDKALAQLLRLHAAFGHAAKVDDLLHSIRGRTLSGPARVARTVARDELWNMRHKPGTTFICGLIALKNLLALQPGRQDFDWLVDVEAPSGGMALSKLAALFAKAELPARMIFRKENQPIPVPSIVHWKVGHFATVVARRGEQFLVKDAVMGRDLWMTRDAINSESSGYFLTGEVGEWRAVAPTEGRHVVGAGITSGNNPDATSNDDVDVCGCGGGSSSSGMARYSVKAMLVSLSIHDTPVG